MVVVIVVVVAGFELIVIGRRCCGCCCRWWALQWFRPFLRCTLCMSCWEMGGGRVVIVKLRWENSIKNLVRIVILNT